MSVRSLKDEVNAASYHAHQLLIMRIIRWFSYCTPDSELILTRGQQQQMRGTNNTSKSSGQKKANSSIEEHLSVENVKSTIHAHILTATKCEALLMPKQDSGSVTNISGWHAGLRASRG